MCQFVVLVTCRTILQKRARNLECRDSERHETSVELVGLSQAEDDHRGVLTASRLLGSQGGKVLVSVHIAVSDTWRGRQVERRASDILSQSCFPRRCYSSFGFICSTTIHRTIPDSFLKMTIPQTFLVSVVLSILYYVLQICVRRHNRSKLVSEHNCMPPKRYYQPERLIGWGLLKENFHNSRNRKILTAGRARFEKYGYTFSSVMGFVHIVATTEPENVKAILATRFNDFDLGTRREKAFRPLLGYGIFCTDGARGEHSRALLRPSFVRSRVADFDMLEIHVKKLLRLIPRDGSVVDLQKMFFDFTMDTASEFLVGTSVDRLGNPDEKESQLFVDAFSYAQRCLIDRTRYGAFLPFYRNKQFNTSVRICHEWIDKFVHQNLECRVQAGKGKQSEGYTFLEELSRRSRSAKDLRDQLLCVLLAGRDTTAGLLSNVFYFLARHKNVLQRLQSEVAALQGRPPSFEEVKQMKYLTNVINECG